MKINKISFNKLLTIFLVVVLITMTMLPARASSQNLNEIKVLLLNGKGANEHYVTLSSQKGINLTTNSQVAYTYQNTTNESVSIQYDRYHLQLLETTSISAAQSMVDKVQAYTTKKLIPNIEVIDQNGQQSYRVVVGGFDTYEAANSLKLELKQKLNVDAKILGFLNWSAGEFANDVDANNKAQELKNNGFYGYVVKVFNGTQWVYQVWVGQAGTVEELQQSKTAISAKIPSITLTEVNYNSPYVIEKKNGTIKNGTLTTNNLIVLSRSTVATIKANDSASTITVKERSYQGNSNSYRGELSLRLNNGDLAVINTLPLETYLYAVVGSEVGYTWPQEALKAQTVAARTFAYNKLLNPRSSLYNIYDTTDDQAYYGVAKESTTIRSAVDGTKGQVILYNGKPINTFYSSNSGGTTSHGSEVWGNDVPYTSVKSSQWDTVVLETTPKWYRLMRNNGQTGYIRSDFINVSASKNDLGMSLGNVNGDNINFRTGPSSYRFPVITTLPKGEEVTILETVYENNAYSWIAGPFTAEYIMQNANQYQKAGQPQFTQPILDLQVIERGPSDRVTLIADGNTPIPVKYPDYYRTFFGGLTNGVQSTLFDIEQTGRIQVLGAYGYSVSVVNNKNQTYVQSATAVTTMASANKAQEEYVVIDKDKNFRLATKDQKYILHGNGLGHGLGMSQYGIKGMAEAGYNYQEILGYYYNNIEISTIY